MFKYRIRSTQDDACEQNRAKTAYAIAIHCSVWTLTWVECAMGRHKGIKIKFCNSFSVDIPKSERTMCGRWTRNMNCKRLHAFNVFIYHIFYSSLDFVCVADHHSLHTAVRRCRTSANFKHMLNAFTRFVNNLDLSFVLCHCFRRKWWK